MKPVLLYDGACRFCTSSAQFTRRWVDRRVRFAVVPSQHADLGALGVTEQQAAEALVFVDADGTASHGARAVAAALRHGAWPWRPVGWLLDAPGVRTLADSVYRRVAARRTCAMPRPVSR